MRTELKYLLGASKVTHFRRPCVDYGYQKVKHHTVSTAHAYYMNKCKEAGIEPVNRHDYIKILDYYAGRVVDRIINKGQRWDIPCNLGTVQVVACPRTDRPNIDWSHFNETEEIAYHMPIGTNKYLYKVLWARPLKRQHHIQNYKFNFARPLRGILVDAIKSGLNYELIR